MSNQSPMSRFVDKVAIVTGGANGIGLATVEELCREGCRVAFSDLSGADGTALVERLQAEGHQAVFFQGNMGNEAFCATLANETLHRFGRINLLVNNAFAFTAAGLQAGKADWQKSYFVGPVGFARMCQSVCRPMQEVGGGAIVNVGSISGHIAQQGRWTYSMAKGAVDQLTKCAALDMAPYGIRVNSVSPGWIWSREVENAAKADGGGREKYGPIWGRYHMLRRCGETREVARAILFLLSDDASFVTGSDLAVDGGYLAMGPEGLGDGGLVVGSRF